MYDQTIQRIRWCDRIYVIYCQSLYKCSICVIKQCLFRGSLPLWYDVMSTPQWPFRSGHLECTASPFSMLPKDPSFLWVWHCLEVRTLGVILVRQSCAIDCEVDPLWGLGVRSLKTKERKHHTWLVQSVEHCEYQIHQ